MTDPSNGTDKLGVLVRGAGWVAGEHVKAYLRNPHVEIRHVDARFEREIDECFATHGFRCDKSVDRYEEALERDDVDIVSICTISSLHAREAVLAAEAGKHVMIEKPAVLTLPELRQLEAAVRQAGVKSAVGFVVRWYPRIVSIKSQVDKGALGDLFYAGAAYWHEVHGEWKAKAGTAGSSLLMGGCHAVDLVRWFVGMDERVEEVFAYANGPTRRHDFDYPPNIFVTMKFENGVVGAVGSSLECSMPYVFALELLGTRGAVRGDQLYSEDFQGGVEFRAVPGVGPDSPDVAHHPFDAEIDEFVDWVRGGPAMSTNTLDAVHTHEIVFAAEQSVRSRTPVRLPIL